jgi:hypothetical protein
MVGISSEAFGCIGIINHLFLSCALYLGSKLPPLAQALNLLAPRSPLPQPQPTHSSFDLFHYRSPDIHRLAGPRSSYFGQVFFLHNVPAPRHPENLETNISVL